MKTKTLIFLLAGILLLTGILYLVVRFQRSDKEVADYLVPKLQVAQIQVSNLTSKKADMNMRMVLNNPAPVGIRLDSLHYVVYINADEVARSTYPDSIRVESRDSTLFSLPLTLYFDKLQTVVQQLQQQGHDSANYKLDATIFSDAAILPKGRFDIEIDKDLPLLYAPELKIADINIRDVGLSGATLHTEIVITNKNAFEIGFQNLHYSVQLEDNESVEGTKPEPVSIPPNGSTTIRIPAEISFKEMGKNLIDLIRKGDDVQYRFAIYAELNSDTEMLNNSKINLNTSGKLKSAIEAAESLSE